MKHRYFANVMARIEFEVEAPDTETADKLAEEHLNKARWDEFNEVGAEIGRYGEGGLLTDWEEVLRYGEI